MSAQRRPGSPSAAKEREHALFVAAQSYHTEVVPIGNDADELAAYHALDAALGAYDSWCPLHGGFDLDQRGPGLCPYCVAADRLPDPDCACAYIITRHCPIHGTPVSAAVSPAEPRRFRKRPVVIEAMQWDGTRPSVEKCCRWVNDGADEPILDYVFFAANDVIDVQIATLEGHHRVSPGDWIIRGVRGEFYACKPDIFEATMSLSDPSVSPADCAECGGRGEVPVTPGQPGDGPMPCPRCAVSPADTLYDGGCDAEPRDLGARGALGVEDSGAAARVPAPAGRGSARQDLPDPLALTPFPADTIRHFLALPSPAFADEWTRWDKAKKAAVAALDELLAVGERDKAKLERALQGETHWARQCERLCAPLDLPDGTLMDDAVTRVESLVAERERDRQHIERLTEALELAPSPGTLRWLAAVLDVMDAEDAWPETMTYKLDGAYIELGVDGSGDALQRGLRAFADAVLAGEEDARER